MSPYDFLVVGIYLCFIALIGVAFRKFSKDSSDFFRGGGHVLWWMVGATAFMSQFSSWTFTGAASKAYTDGTLVMVIYLGNALGYFIAYLWSAAQFRQMRVVTPMEGVRDRFGKGNEQFFTWVWIPMGIFYAAIWLSAVSTFVSVVFQMNMTVTIVVVGSVVLLVAALGGAWAVVASDFMQMMILLPISMVAAFLAIQAVGGGHFVHGLTSFVGRLPANHLNWSAVLRPRLVVMWVAAILLKQFCTTNNMKDSNRFLFARDSRTAKKAALLASVLFLVGPIIWFIPPMAAAILYPNLAAIPELGRLGHNATDGAYVAIGLRTMPMGMIGLMVSAIFAATMSNMDTGLNNNAGIFIRNFYKPVLRPLASEREYLIAGKATSLVFGVLIILAALRIEQFKGVGLFDVMMYFSSMVAIPFVIPLILGVMVKRAPPWAGWSTVCIGFASSVVCSHYRNADFFWKAIGLDSAVRPREMADYLVVISIFMNVAVGTVWFLGAALFHRLASRGHAAREQEFFERLEKPVESKPEETKAMDLVQLKTLSRLCLPYGSFVMALCLVPNPPAGRVSFLFSGGLIAGMGLLLRRKARQAAGLTGRRETVAAPAADGRG